MYDSRSNLGGSILGSVCKDPLSLLEHTGNTQIVVGGHDFSYNKKGKRDDVNARLYVAHRQLCSVLGLVNSILHPVVTR